MFVNKNAVVFNQRCNRSARSCGIAAAQRASRWPHRRPSPQAHAAPAEGSRAARGGRPEVGGRRCAASLTFTPRRWPGCWPRAAWALSRSRCRPEPPKFLPTVEALTYFAIRFLRRPQHPWAPVSGAVARWVKELGASAAQTGLKLVKIVQKQGYPAQKNSGLTRKTCAAAALKTVCRAYKPPFFPPQESPYPI